MLHVPTAELPVSEQSSCQCAAFFRTDHLPTWKVSERQSGGAQDGLAPRAIIAAVDDADGSELAVSGVVPALLPSLEGKLFAALECAEAGEVSSETVFEYHESDGVVWARYAGGAIRLGFLVGKRAGDRLEFRYSHVNDSGETAGGVCASLISRGEDGRLLLAERWRWESKPGEGTSILCEVPRR